MPATAPWRRRRLAPPVLTDSKAELLAAAAAQVAGLLRETCKDSALLEPAREYRERPPSDLSRYARLHPSKAESAIASFIARRLFSDCGAPPHTVRLLDENAWRAFMLDRDERTNAVVVLRALEEVDFDIKSLFEAFVEMEEPYSVDGVGLSRRALFLLDVWREGRFDNMRDFLRYREPFDRLVCACRTVARGIWPRRFEKIFEELATHVSFMPGSSGMRAARDHFDTARASAGFDNPHDPPHDNHQDDE